MTTPGEAAAKSIDDAAKRLEVLGEERLVAYLDSVRCIDEDTTTAIVDQLISATLTSKGKVMAAEKALERYFHEFVQTYRVVAEVDGDLAFLFDADSPTVFRASLTADLTDSEFYKSLIRAAPSSRAINVDFVYQKKPSDPTYQLKEIRQSGNVVYPINSSFP